MLLQLIGFITNLPCSARAQSVVTTHRALGQMMPSLRNLPDSLGASKFITTGLQLHTLRHTPQRITTYIYCQTPYQLVHRLQHCTFTSAKLTVTPPTPSIIHLTHPIFTITRLAGLAIGYLSARGGVYSSSPAEYKDIRRMYRHDACDMQFLHAL